MSSKAKLQSLLTKIANWDEFYYGLDEPGLGTPGENGPALTLFRFSLSMLYTKYWLKPLQIYSAGINGSGWQLLDHAGHLGGVIFAWWVLLLTQAGRGFKIVSLSLLTAVCTSGGWGKPSEKAKLK